MNLMSDKIWTYPLRLVAHYFVAVFGGMIVGFFPELWLGHLYRYTPIEPFTPAIAFTALLLGYFLSYRLDRVHLAGWTWILGLVWLLYGAHELTSSWSASWSNDRSALDYARRELFGLQRFCGDTECLYQFVFTTPFAASLMYSVGGFLKSLREAQTSP